MGTIEKVASGRLREMIPLGLKAHRQLLIQPENAAVRMLAVKELYRMTGIKMERSKALETNLSPAQEQVLANAARVVMDQWTTQVEEEEAKSEAPPKPTTITVIPVPVSEVRHGNDPGPSSEGTRDLQSRGSGDREDGPGEAQS